MSDLTRDADLFRGEWWPEENVVEELFQAGRRLSAALDAAEKERDELRVDYESSLNASARLMKERDEAYRRVGEADAQRMVALRKNEAAWAQVDALEKERDEAQDALQALRATWNAHFETCSAPLPCGVTMADLEAWRDAPSNTASVTPLLHCRYCGSLAWTVTKYGRVTHKQSCPHRTDPWHQSAPLVRQHEDDGA